MARGPGARHHSLAGDMAQTNRTRAEVDQFVLTHIDTVPHLETLLLLWNERLPWSAKYLAVRLYIDPTSVEKILQDLTRQGLAMPDVERPDLYRYNATSAGQDRLVQLTAAAYNRELVRTSTLIHSKAAPAIREFTRAFRFRQDKKDKA